MKLRIPIYKAQFLIFLIVFASIPFATGCPKSVGAVKAAVDASYRLPADTNDLIAKIAAGRDSGILSVEDARKFGDVLNKMAKAEVVFVDSVKALNATYQATNHFDPAVMRQLKTYFDTQIVGPFLEVLENARVLSGSAGQAILLAITAVRLLLRTIGNGFGSSNMRVLSATH